jgi:hypothetical protein
MKPAATNNPGMQNDSPSTTASNGRGPKGRFGPGNRLAMGNPHAAQVSRLRSALLDAVTPADIRAVVKALLAQARGGDVPAIRELLQRLLGPPVELDVLERLDRLEERLAQAQKEQGA